MVTGAPARLERARRRAFAAALLPAVLGCSACTDEPGTGTSSTSASSATVEGDWVAWMDDRDSSAVNASIDTPRDRFDIYGYNLATRQEVHLAGNEAGDITKLYPVLPQLHGGKLYVVGNNDLGDFTNSQLYEFLVP